MRFQEEAKIDDMIIGAHQRCHIMMAIPTLGMVPIEFMFAAMRMQMPMNGQVFQHVVKGYEVGEARNKAVEAIMMMPKAERPKYLFFFGDDMIPEWDAFVRLYEMMELEKWDMLTALYYLKMEPPTPLVWRDSIVGAMQPVRDFTVGERVAVDMTGMDFTLIRVSLLEEMEIGPWFKTGPSLRILKDEWLEPHIQQESVVAHTEDAWFMKRAKALGAKMGVHTGVRVSHLDVKTGNIY
jgi:hypothetical protein